MKNRIPIVFILALTLPFIGIYAWLKFEKTAIQKTVKRQLMEGIPKDELIQLTFALTDTATLLDWKHGKEFEFNGEMYDIVTRYYSVDSVKYDLWWDHQETKLNRKLAKLTNSLINQNPKENSKNGFISFVLKSMYHQDNQTALKPPFESTEETSIYDIEDDSLLSRYIKPISPPPKLFV